MHDQKEIPPCGTRWLPPSVHYLHFLFSHRNLSFWKQLHKVLKSFVLCTLCCISITSINIVVSRAPLCNHLSVICKQIESRKSTNDKYQNNENDKSNYLESWAGRARPNMCAYTILGRTGRQRDRTAVATKTSSATTKLVDGWLWKRHKKYKFYGKSIHYSTL